MVISLKSTRDFIEMYEMQNVLTVLKCANGYQVSHAVNKDDYVCKNITAAAECVNDIIFNRTPMNVTLVDERV